MGAQSGGGVAFRRLCGSAARNDNFGLHTHGLDDEELYVIVAGTGTMTVDDLQFEVGPGDVVINRPGGAHGLANTSRHNLRIVVIDNGATPEAAQGAPPASN